ncbi:MAG: ABC transporter permease [Gemmatimonadota bacterium]
MFRGVRRWLRVPRSPEEQARRDVDDEVSFHLDMRTAELIGLGKTETEARAMAEREFGDPERDRERLRREATKRERDTRLTQYFDELQQDLRYGVRALRERPGFAAVAILTLALGVAATTTIFSVFQGIMLRPLPVAEPDRVVVPHKYEIGNPDGGPVSYADYLDWQERGFFEASAVYLYSGADLRVGGEPERFTIALVTEEFFAALGARAHIGRTLTKTDFDPSAPRAMVLSYEVWQSRFAGDSSTVGRTIGSIRPATIVGVLERGAEWPRDVTVWLPLTLTGAVPADWLERDNYQFWTLARLKAGHSLEQTRAQLAAHAKSIAQQYPTDRANKTLSVVTIQEELLGAGLPRALWILLASVTFVLLIGCANIANLLLVRGAARRREFAVRLAMGARPGRLARQLLTESLLLGLIGGTLGVVLSRWGVDLLVHYAPADVPRVDEIGVNAPVMLAGLTASMVAAMLFGLAPMLQATRVGAAETIADTSNRSSGGRYATRLRRALVVSELALSVMLLVGAGLLLRSLLRLQHTDPGFRAENLITLSLRLSPTRYPDNAAEAGFYRQVVDRLSAIPGVEGATVSSALPLGGGGFYLGRVFVAEGRPQPPAGTDLDGQWNVVGPGFFATLRMPLTRGREFTLRDDSASTPVMIVNQEFAEKMFPGENPLGKRVRSWRDENLLREIVGVVPNVRYFAAGDEIRPLVYVPHGQNTWSSMSLIVRTRSAVESILPLVRKEIKALDPNIALADVTTMEKLRDNSIARPRFNALLLALFAGLALMLATFGIYGVLSYGVSQRTREIGVRMALGARAGDVTRLVLGEALMLVGVGVGIGLLGAFAGARALSTLLFELDARDPATFAVVAILLGAIALAASYVPARRATAVPPVTAIRRD